MIATDIDIEKIIAHEIPAHEAKILAKQINTCLRELPVDLAWQKISKHILTTQHTFSLHLAIFTFLFPNWHKDPTSAPAWIPETEIIRNANMTALMKEVGVATFAELRQWINHDYFNFWKKTIDQLNIVFQKKYDVICDLSAGITSPNWLVNAKMNIVDSCFNAPTENTALIFYDKNNNIIKFSFGELQNYINRIANGLTKNGFQAGDAIAIIMPMTVEAVAIYLAILKIGGVVVSIADSFSTEEIDARLKIANAKTIFTQDCILRGDKKLPLYSKIISAKVPTTIILSCTNAEVEILRAEDIAWSGFLSDDILFESYACDPMSPCNILFSSGTTGNPKAIPWNHTTAIKAASDAYFHQNIKAGDVLAWPTNLGWMMGPWLIFAALINQAAIAIYPDVARDVHFGKFVQDAKVTMLGVVPTLVSTWRHSQCMEGLDWSNIKIFSSTGECSNPEDMLYLMSLANYKPIIEYCGGTEIGGAYLTSTVIEKNYPSVFTTPALGLDLLILDEDGHPAEVGEVALIPPSMGLSTTLLNADHEKIYYSEMPLSPDGKILRRHGDQIRRLKNGYYSLLGRGDDAMNLGGIKISSTEIERVVVGIPGVDEVAAVAISPAGSGPSQLVIFAVTSDTFDKYELIKIMQTKINTLLNPLFKISDVVFIKELPKTASNKIMRRMLRNLLEEK